MKCTLVMIMAAEAYNFLLYDHTLVWRHAVIGYYGYHK